MLQEMRYIEQELLPMLRERKAKQDAAARTQLNQWAGKRGVCSLMLGLDADSVPELKMLPAYNLEEIHYDIEKMFVNELRSAIGVALAEGDGVPSVRANVGCGCINTLLGGVKQTFYPDKMPWLHERIAPDVLMELTKADITESEEFKFGLECMRYMKRQLEGTGIQVYPMDIQGPVDMAHLWLGNDFFYDVYDEPELVHHALQLAVECDEYAFNKCLEIIRPEEFVAHYNCLALPADKPMKISEDTSTLLCGEHLEEYMQPYTAQLFDRVGGGYIPYCGDNKFLLPIVTAFEHSCIGMNFGNPERHDFAKLFPELNKRGKSYISTGGAPFLSEEIVREACAEDGSFHMFFRMNCSRDEQQKLLEARDRFVENALKG